MNIQLFVKGAKAKEVEGTEAWILLWIAGWCIACCVTASAGYGCIRCRRMESSIIELSELLWQ